jgi:hypothetical protein
MRIPGRLAGADFRLPLAAQRPGWLTGAAIRLAVLCGFIVAIDMLSPRLTPHQAGRVLLFGVIAVVAVAVAAVVWTRAAAAGIEHLMPGLSGPARRAGAALALLRHVGLPLLGLAFFLFWTFVYVGMWWYAPHRAFTGLAPLPRFADFFYYAVSTGLISPPGDIIASSRGARSATLVEMITGLALVTAYVSSFSDLLGRGSEPRGEAPDSSP